MCVEQSELCASYFTKYSVLVSDNVKSVLDILQDTMFKC